MYKQAKKPQENKTTAVANSVAQKKSSGKQGFGFVDNRARSGVQALIGGIDTHHSTLNETIQKKGETIGKLLGVVQMVKAVKPKANLKKSPSKPSAKKERLTVRNKKDDYTSGWITETSYAQGVDKAPRAEAQKVARLLGGSWVGGHMVNDQLGGDGGFKNIVPITSSMNGRHKTIENLANNALSSSFVKKIKYNMKIRKRDTVTNGPKTVLNLPTAFEQSLNIKNVDGTNQTVNGPILN
ncbi:hypothetical protein F9U42_04195 [Pectobacterium versatile]|uniref:DNA/RNA non-specific endonuclease n=1 Tax=Pectobacterium versatile TaxID=2488639 RepID=UPI001B38FC69|nr:DNA/RNA non-specific endonuclease [Pectobacterium versatile]MBQ4766333.1 hypothetical protein [Pectobacterium versatile]